MPRIEPLRRGRVVVPRLVLVALACCGLLPGMTASAAEAAASAAASAPQGASPPRVRIAAVRGVSWHGSQARIDLLLQVSNPRGWSVVLNDIRLRCSFNGVATATGHSTGKLALPAHGQADVPMSVTIDGQALLAVLAALPPDGTVHYALDGDAEIGDTLLRIPFQQQGTVVLK